MPEAFQDEEAADAGSGGLGDEAVGASETSFPLETSITITKPSGGAMTIDAIAQGEPSDVHPLSYLLIVPGRIWRNGRLTSSFTISADGLFTINNIAFYPDADLALGMSSEDDWKRQGLYMGPAVSLYLPIPPAEARIIY